MSDGTIRKAIYLASDAQTVWHYLTDAEALGTWFHPAEASLAEGQDFTLVSQKDGDRMCWGKVREMHAPAHMVWEFTVGPLSGQMTRVEWRITEVAGGVRLELEHSGLPATAEGFGLLGALDKGWHGFLQNLYALGS